MRESQETSFLDTRAFAFWRIFESAKAAVLANPGPSVASENARCTLRFVVTHINQLPDDGVCFTLLKTSANLFAGFYDDLGNNCDFADAMAACDALMRDRFSVYLGVSRQMSDGERHFAVKTITAFFLSSDVAYEVYGPDGTALKSTRALWLLDFGVNGPSPARRAANEATEAAFRVKLLGEESTP